MSFVAARLVSRQVRCRGNKIASPSYSPLWAGNVALTEWLPLLSLTVRAVTPTSSSFPAYLVPSHAITSCLNALHFFPSPHPITASAPTSSFSPYLLLLYIVSPHPPIPHHLLRSVPTHTTSSLSSPRLATPRLIQVSFTPFSIVLLPSPPRITPLRSIPHHSTVS